MNGDRDTEDAPAAEAPTILIAEDYSDTRALLCEILKGRGYTVVEAMNGKEAIVSASRHNPDLIIMDLAMPQMDGIEALRRIRGVPKLASTPIIVASAYITEEVRSEVLAMSRVAVFAKPLDTDALLERIKVVLGEHPNCSARNDS